MYIFRCISIYIYIIPFNQHVLCFHCYTPEPFVGSWVGPGPCSELNHWTGTQRVSVYDLHEASFLRPLLGLGKAWPTSRNSKGRFGEVFFGALRSGRRTSHQNSRQARCTNPGIVRMGARPCGTWWIPALPGRRGLQSCRKVIPLKQVAIGCVR